MAILIDRTKESNRLFKSRQRFLLRFKKEIHTSLIDGGIIDDKQIFGPNKVRLHADTIEEPFFVYDYNSEKVRFDNRIIIKNKVFNKGDEIKTLRNPSGSEGSGAGNQGGEGDDIFGELEFYLEESEIADQLFGGLELPDFIRKSNKVELTDSLKSAGTSKTGLRSNVNLLQTYKEAYARKVVRDGICTKEREDLQEELKTLVTSKNHSQDTFERSLQINDKLLELEEKLKRPVKLDDIDLRFRNKIFKTDRINKAVIFLVLDASGSMSTIMFNIAKQLFYLFSLFIKTNYKTHEIVYIVHSHTAVEVTREQFFSVRQDGGTYFLSAFKLVKKIIDDRFDYHTNNIYYAHVSDGEYSDDLLEVSDYFKAEILPVIQYGFMAITTSTLDNNMLKLRRSIEICKKFVISNIGMRSECVAFLRQLFRKST